MNCHGCGTANEVDRKTGRGDVCAKCGRPLRCCRNCTFFDPLAHNMCRETQSEWVSDREGANFCEFFTPRTGGGTNVATDKAEQARKKLDDLFS